MENIAVYKQKENVIFFLDEVDRDKFVTQLKEFCDIYGYKLFFNFDYDQDTPLEGNINQGDLSGEDYLSIRYFLTKFDKENVQDQCMAKFKEAWGAMPKSEILIYGSRSSDEHVLIVNLIKFLQPIYKKMAFEQIENVIWFDEALLEFYPD